MKTKNSNSNNIFTPLKKLRIKNNNSKKIKEKDDEICQTIKSIKYLKANRTNYNNKLQNMKMSSKNFFNKNIVQENYKLNNLFFKNEINVKGINKIKIIKLKHNSKELNKQNINKETDKFEESYMYLINSEIDRKNKNIDNIENNNKSVIFNDKIKKIKSSSSKQNKNINKPHSMRLINRKHNLFHNKILINSL